MISLPQVVVQFAIVLVALVCTSTASYRAAVVEFHPDQFNLPNVRIRNNLAGFKAALETVQQAGGADIVVFPEDAILGEAFFTREAIEPYLENIPHVSTSQSDINPCSDPAFKDRPILQNLSCLAEEYKVVLVANMGDIQPCTNEQCPSDGKYHFNTNVVFESEGTLIAKYHKVNLYAGETKIFNPGTHSNTSCVSFDTSFGVTFGTFTCYDLLFQEPANCLLSKNVENFVLPTAWGSLYPFYMSTAVQQGWSRKHGVNFLAANQQFSLTYSTGSGLYSKGVAMHYIISGKPWTTGTGRVIMGDFSQDINATQVGDISDVSNIKVKDSTHLNYTALSSKEGTVEVEYRTTNFSLECRLEYSIKSSPAEKESYALGAYIGVSRDDPNFHYAVCTLVKCPQSGQCGEQVEGYKTNTVLGNVKLSGTFANGSEVYVTALGDGLQLLEPDTMEVGKDSVTITDAEEPLLAVSLWTRVYK